MLAIVIALAVVGARSTSAAAPSTAECVFGDGVPAPQPGHEGDGLTCTPTTRTGGGTITLHGLSNPEGTPMYRDALTFSCERVDPLLSRPCPLQC